MPRSHFRAAQCFPKCELPPPEEGSVCARHLTSSQGSHQGHKASWQQPASEPDTARDIRELPGDPRAVLEALALPFLQWEHRKAAGLVCSFGYDLSAARQPLHPHEVE